MEELEKDNEIVEESTLLDEYNKLKDNSIPKDVYEREIKALKDKNALYLKAITEGSKVEPSVEDSGSIQDAIADISKFKGTNLEYWQKMTKATDQALKSLPQSEIEKMIGSDGLDELVKVNEGMKQMVEDSKGDPDYFRTIYRARVQDSAPRISSEIEKVGGVVNYFNKNQK